MFFYVPGMSILAIYVLAAVLPAVFLMRYVYRKDTVEKEPPAFSWGFTLTISRPYFNAASSSMIMARFKCSQHWAAR